MLPVPIEPRREQQYSYLQKHVKTPILVQSSSAIMIAFYFIFKEEGFRNLLFLFLLSP